MGQSEHEPTEGEEEAPHERRPDEEAQRGPYRDNPTRVLGPGDERHREDRRATDRSRRA